MHRFIIEESGFPKNRETLKEFQEQFTKPIDELLKLLPGNRILWGCEKEDNGAGNVLISAGQIVYNGVIYDIEAYDGADTNLISLFETIEQASFNTGTAQSPVLDNRDFKTVWSGQWGDVANNDHLVNITTLSRGRKVMEYLASGTTYLGYPTGAIGDSIYEIPVNTTTREYFVLGTVRPITGETLPGEVPFLTRNYSTTQFELVINNEIESQRLLFDWILVAKNDPTFTEVE